MMNIMNNQAINRLELNYYNGHKFENFLNIFSKDPVMLRVICVDNLTRGRAIIKKINGKNTDIMSMYTEKDNIRYKCIHRHNIELLHGLNPEKIYFEYIPDSIELDKAIHQTHAQKGSVYILGAIYHDWKGIDQKEK